MRSLIILALALTLGGAPGVGLAQSQAERPPGRESPRDQPSAEALAREAVEKLVQALSVLLKSLPQYEMPEINDDGDIIIRRVRPKREPGPAPAPRRQPSPLPEEGTRT